MKILDKGNPLSKMFCDLCKKEIEPGEEMVISMSCPSHEDQANMRFMEVRYYFFYDNAPKYHKECYLKKIKEKNPER